jgi:carbon storage regulator
MLILTRRAGEAILIDGGVRIVVLGTDGGGVRLGIEAPPSIGIVREEVVQRIAEENVRAGATEKAKDWLQTLGGSPPQPPGGGSPPPDQGEKGGG